jgi:N-acetylglutamate synthase-like GNAT family acetyltransferase
MTAMKWQVEPARAHDLGPAVELLQRCELSTEGVAERFGNYLVARDDAVLVGLAGLEIYAGDALLRSVAVDPGLRRQGLGTQLVSAAEDLARRLSLKTIYLLTTAERGFFSRLSYQDCARETLPERLRESWERRAGWPASAVVMMKTVG